MGRMVKGFSAVVFGLLALVALLYVVSRAMPIPRHEAEALARVEAMPPLRGTNGFAALWVAARDVDVSRAGSLLAEEGRRLAAMPAQDAEGKPRPYVSVLEEFPMLPRVAAKKDLFCGMHESGCLAKVRSDPAAYAALAAVQQQAAARVAALDTYDHFLNPLPPRMDGPLPTYEVLTRDITVQAQRFSIGETDAALEGVCRDASLARKLMTSGDSLITAMVGSALQKGSTALFVDMLSELPPDHPLPANCEKAFRVDGTEVKSICPTLRAEGRWSTEAYRALARGETGNVRAALFLDVDKTMARGALMFDGFCNAEANATIAADKPLRAPRPRSPYSVACIANAVGCTLTGIQAPAYVDYALRLQDADMRQKAIGTWLWLRSRAGEDARTLEARVAARPGELKSASRDIRVEGDHLVVPTYEKRPGVDDVWRLPLPDWMSSRTL